MSRLDRYVGSATLLSMCATLLGGGLLMFIFTMLDMLQGPTQEGLLDSLLRALRTMPRKVEELAPFAVFLGALIGLGNLSSNSELTVLRGAGVSVTRLFISVCIPSAFILLLASLVIPLVFAQDERGASARSTGFESGWLSEGRIYTRLGAQLEEGVLTDVQQYELDETGMLVSSTRSERAVYDPDVGWSLINVTKTEYLDSELVVSTLDTMPWQIERDPSSFQTLFTKSPRKMSLLELNQQIDALKAVGEDAAEFQIIFWTKLLKPLNVFGLVLIALVFVVGSSRVIGMGTRLTFGVLVGFAFHYIQTLIAPISIVFGVPAVVTIAAPLVVIWASGLYLARRMV